MMFEKEMKKSIEELVENVFQLGKPTREYKYKKAGDDYIYSFYEYKECRADKEVDDHLLIREDDSEWREPLVEE